MPSAMPERLMAERTCDVMSIISSRVAVFTSMTWISLVCAAGIAQHLVIGGARPPAPAPQRPTATLGTAVAPPCPVKAPMALAAFALGACVVGGVKRPITDVAIEGNKAIGDGDIIEHLATQPPSG